MALRRHDVSAYNELASSSGFWYRIMPWLCRVGRKSSGESDESCAISCSLADKFAAPAVALGNKPPSLCVASVVGFVSCLLLSLYFRPGHFVAGYVVVLPAAE